MQLSDILIEAVYGGVRNGRLGFHEWGKQISRDTFSEHAIGAQMATWVNSHYSGPGNRFFWATINKAISEIYEPDERSE